jgi:hypothetical protein
LRNLDGIQFPKNGNKLMLAGTGRTGLPNMAISIYRSILVQEFSYVFMLKCNNLCKYEL